MAKIVLCSGSPRRQELLRRIGIEQFDMARRMSASAKLFAHFADLKVKPREHGIQYA